MTRRNRSRWCRFLSRTAAGLVLTAPLLGSPLAVAQESQPIRQASAEDVQAHLKALYDRDGRQMPELNFRQTPVKPPVVEQQEQRAQATTRQRSAAPKRRSLMDIFRPQSWKNKQAPIPKQPPVEPAPFVPRQQPNRLPQAEAKPVQNAKSVARQQPTPQPVSPAQDSPRFALTEPVARYDVDLGALMPGAFQDQEVTADSQLPAGWEQFDLGVIVEQRIETAATRAAEQPVIEGFADDKDSQQQETPAVAESTAEAAGDNTKPESGTAAVSDSPYTGLTLDDGKELVVPDPADVAEAPRLSVPGIDSPASEIAKTSSLRSADSTVSNTERGKMALIRAREGETGYKGFCPVSLRDNRDLVDAQPEHHSRYDEQDYYFASAEAKAAFELAPKLYAPVEGGKDIVKLEAGEQIGGSLDHAVWYRGRLYMFATTETMQAFAAAPKSYAR